MWWQYGSYGNPHDGWGAWQGWGASAWRAGQSDPQTAVAAPDAGAPAPQAAVAAPDAGASAPQSAVAAPVAGAPAHDAGGSARNDDGGGGDGVGAVPPPIPPPPGADPPQSRVVLDLAYFKRLKVDVRWTQHNIALKYGRMLCLRKNTKEIVFGHWPYRVPLCIHPSGTEFKFDEGHEAEAIEWHWVQLVANIVDEDLPLVVNGQGEKTRCRGLVSCKLKFSPKYDHKMAHAGKMHGTLEKGQMPGSWDFVLERDDGSLVILHPNFSNKKVDVRFAVLSEDWEVPETGPGGSSGPCTFKYFKNKGVDCHVKLDTRKSSETKGFVTCLKSSAVAGGAGASSSAVDGGAGASSSAVAAGAGASSSAVASGAGASSSAVSSSAVAGGAGASSRGPYLPLPPGLVAEGPESASTTLPSPLPLPAAPLPGVDQPPPADSAVAGLLLGPSPGGLDLCGPQLKDGNFQ